MNVAELIKKIEANIAYQQKKLEFLFYAKSNGDRRLLEIKASGGEPDSNEIIANQSLADSTLNSMASLVDYYYMYCFMRLGVREDKITKVQYRALNNQAVVYDVQKKPIDTPDEFKSKFDKKISEMTGMAIGDIDPNFFWPAFLGPAITLSLHSAGIVSEKSFDFGFTDGEFEISDLAIKYHAYFRSFFCNQWLNCGVKYNLYIEVNNFLKHNMVPYVSSKIELFEGEMRGFSYFEFNNEDSVFLKSGILKNLVDSSFDELQDALELISRDEYSIRPDLEKRWGMGAILKVDRQNGYSERSDGHLYFFIDNVLVAKSRESTFIDSGSSLKKTLGSLLRDIEVGMNLDFSEF